MKIYIRVEAESELEQDTAVFLHSHLLTVAIESIPEEIKEFINGYYTSATFENTEIISSSIERTDEELPFSEN